MRILRCMLLTLTLVVSHLGAANILGQLVNGSAKVDGLTAPSGTTIFGSSTLRALQTPVTVHLISGQILSLSANTEAIFEAEGENTRIAVRSGVLTYRRRGEEPVSAPSGSVLLVKGGSILPVTPEIDNVVAVLVSEAAEGDLFLEVNDASRIDRNRPIQIRQTSEEEGEDHSIAEVEDSTVLRLKDPIGQGFLPHALVFQFGRNPAALLIPASGGAGLAALVGEDEGVEFSSPTQPE